MCDVDLFVSIWNPLMEGYLLGTSGTQSDGSGGDKWYLM